MIETDARYFLFPFTFIIKASPLTVLDVPLVLYSLYNNNKEKKGEKKKKREKRV